MPSAVVLSVFIASTTTFEVAVGGGEEFQRASFPNSDEGIRASGHWIQGTGTTNFDQICVSGPSIGITPAFKFWSTRDVPVLLLYFGQVEQYMKQNGIENASAEVVARTCISMMPFGQEKI